MAQDSLKIQILGDGTIKALTDEISPANHKNAEEFFRFLASLLGGETSRMRRKQGHVHHHEHQHEHEGHSH